MRLPDGSVLDGKFRVSSPIGSGGFGIVYEALQIKLNRRVAIKVLDAFLSQDQQARFLREAKVLSRLSHRHICSFYAYGVWNAMPYIVIEFLEGEALSSLIRPTGMNTDEILLLLSQVCSALAHAHKHGIIHRDLKPANIIVIGRECGSPQAKLIDFGLAAVMPSCGLDLQKLTTEGAAVGSVLYMSPEQCMGRAVDERSDIYSLGCILYQCLNGKPPFEAENAAAIMLQHASEPVTEQNTNDNAEQRRADLEKIALRCLQKDPPNRFASVDEILEALRTIQSGKRYTDSVRRQTMPAETSTASLARYISPAKITASVVAIFIAVTTAWTIMSPNSACAGLLNFASFMSKHGNTPTARSLFHTAFFVEHAEPSLSRTPAVILSLYSASKAYDPDGVAERAELLQDMLPLLNDHNQHIRLRDQIAELSDRYKVTQGRMSLDQQIAFTDRWINLINHCFDRNDEIRMMANIGAGEFYLDRGQWEKAGNSFEVARQAPLAYQRHLAAQNFLHMLDADVHNKAWESAGHDLLLLSYIDHKSTEGLDLSRFRNALASVSKGILTTREPQESQQKSQEAEAGCFRQIISNGDNPHRQAAISELAALLPELEKQNRFTEASFLLGATMKAAADAGAWADSRSKSELQTALLYLLDFAHKMNKPELLEGALSPSMDSKETSLRAWCLLLKGELYMPARMEQARRCLDEAVAMTSNGHTPNFPSTDTFRLLLDDATAQRMTGSYKLAASTSNRAASFVTLSQQRLLLLMESARLLRQEGKTSAAMTSYCNATKFLLVHSEIGGTRCFVEEVYAFAQATSNAQALQFAQDARKRLQEQHRF